jgi:hypothetical protein
LTHPLQFAEKKTDPVDANGHRPDIEMFAGAEPQNKSSNKIR